MRWHQYSARVESGALRLQSCRSLTGIAVFCGAAALIIGAEAQAGHISSSKDRPGVRTALPGEGYLRFGFAVSGQVGSERTGWTDTRHPAFDGVNINTTDTNIGYDRSDKFVQVHNKVVTVDAGAGPPGTVAAAPNIARDYNYANQIYAQIGLSVLSTGQQAVSHTTGNAQGNNVVANPFNDSTVASVGQVTSQNRQAAPVVNNYYVANSQNGNRGVAIAPSVNAGSAGSVIYNNAANDTFAHELGHVLIDSNNFNQTNVLTFSPGVNGGNFFFTLGGNNTPNLPFNATPAQVQAAIAALPGAGPVIVNGGAGFYVIGTANPPAVTTNLNFAGPPPVNQFTYVVDNGHSHIPTDMMAPGSIRQTPNANTKGGGNTAPSQPGRPNGNIGGRDQFASTVNNGAANINQATAIYNSASVQQNSASASEGTHGDVADFDWVEDNLALEVIGGNVDNHPGVGDGLVFIGGQNTPSTHNGHMHPAGELDLDFFPGGDDFWIVDVISQIARYTDMDVDSAGNWSLRESALDYTLEFSEDGSVWIPGNVTDVFIEGWTTATAAENYVARWTPQTAVDATRIRIRALTGSGHDGNTQIDAVIAAIPEPSSYLMFSMGFALLAVYRNYRRR